MAEGQEFSVIDEAVSPPSIVAREESAVSTDMVNPRDEQETINWADMEVLDADDESPQVDASAPAKAEPAAKAESGENEKSVAVSTEAVLLSPAAVLSDGGKTPTMDEQSLSDHNDNDEMQVLSLAVAEPAAVLEAIPEEPELEPDLGEEWKTVDDVEDEPMADVVSNGQLEGVPVDTEEWIVVDEGEKEWNATDEMPKPPRKRPASDRKASSASATKSRRTDSSRTSKATEHKASKTSEHKTSKTIDHRTSRSANHSHHASKSANRSSSGGKRLTTSSARSKDDKKPNVGGHNCHDHSAKTVRSGRSTSTSKGHSHSRSSLQTAGSKTSSVKKSDIAKDVSKKVTAPLKPSSSSASAERERHRDDAKSRHDRKTDAAIKPTSRIKADMTAPVKKPEEAPRTKAPGQQQDRTKGPDRSSHSQRSAASGVPHPSSGSAPRLHAPREAKNPNPQSKQASTDHNSKRGSPRNAPKNAGLGHRSHNYDGGKGKLPSIHVDDGSAYGLLGQKRPDDKLLLPRKNDGKNIAKLPKTDVGASEKATEKPHKNQTVPGRKPESIQVATESATVAKKEVEEKPLPEPIRRWLHSLEELVYPVRKYTNFYCVACQKVLKTMSSWEDHLTESDHRQNLAVWRECQNLKGSLSAFKSRPAIAQAVVDRSSASIVGIENVIEISGPESRDSDQWVCLICSAVCDTTERLQAHLTSYEHTENYVEMVRPEIFCPPFVDGLDRPGLDAPPAAEKATVLQAAKDSRKGKPKMTMRSYVGPRFEAQDRPDQVDLEETLIKQQMQCLFQSEENFVPDAHLIDAGSSAVNRHISRHPEATSKPSAVVGLQYIFEFWSPSRRCFPVHYCMLCDYVVSDILSHCATMKHTIPYLKRHYRKIYDLVLHADGVESCPQVRRGFELAKKKIQDIEDGGRKIEFVIQLHKGAEVFVAINAAIAKRIITHLDLTVPDPPRKAKPASVKAPPVPKATFKKATPASEARSYRAKGRDSSGSTSRPASHHSSPRVKRSPRGPPSKQPSKVGRSPYRTLNTTASTRFAQSGAPIRSVVSRTRPSPSMQVHVQQNGVRSVERPVSGRTRSSHSPRPDPFLVSPREARGDKPQTVFPPRRTTESRGRNYEYARGHRPFQERVIRSQEKSGRARSRSPIRRSRDSSLRGAKFVNKVLEDAISESRGHRKERELSTADLRRLEVALRKVGVDLGRALTTDDLALLRQRFGDSNVDKCLEQVCSDRAKVAPPPAAVNPMYHAPQMPVAFMPAAIPAPLHHVSATYEVPLRVPPTAVYNGPGAPVVRPTYAHPVPVSGVPAVPPSSHPSSVFIPQQFDHPAPVPSPVHAARRPVTYSSAPYADTRHARKYAR